MDMTLHNRRSTCPYCGEPVELVIDASAGDQSYIEDCEVCCRPMSISFATTGDGHLTLSVERGD